MAIKGLVGGINSSNKIVSSSNNVTNPMSAKIVDNSSNVRGNINDQETYSGRILNTQNNTTYYTGKETDSIVIDVDNVNKVISGEVKWKNMIAKDSSEEDSNHAYPANKARLNFELIDTEIKSVELEIKTLKTSVTKSENSSNSCIETVKQLEETLDSFKQLYNSLRLSLDKEIQQREKDHIELKRKDSENYDSLKNEFNILHLTATNNIENQNKELQANKQKLEAEIIRAKEAEEDIRNSVTSSNYQVGEASKKISNLENKDKELSSRLVVLENAKVVDKSEEHEESINNISSDLRLLENRVNRINSDTLSDIKDIKDVQYKHDSDITKIKSSTKQIEKDVTSLKTADNNIQKYVESVEKEFNSKLDGTDDRIGSLFVNLRGESEIRRESDKLHEDNIDRLDVRISTLQSDLIQVVQNFVDEFRAKDKEIISQFDTLDYDFIDAGNAPI